MQPTNAQATFYLQFVWCAYEMFDADPTSLTPPPPADFPANYTITAYMSSTDPVTDARVFFGFIAVPDSPSDGPGILAIRGTADPYEWLRDFDALPTPFPTFPQAYVATGFYTFVTDIQWTNVDGSATHPDLLMTSGDNWPQGFVLAGHSLGGSMATLLMAMWRGAYPSALLTLVTAAAPAVGDRAFLQGYVACAGGATWRYINELDVIASTYDLIYYQVPTGEPMISYDIYPTAICEHSLTTYFYLLSAPGTECTSDCCIVDDDATGRLSTVAEQKRPLRVAAQTGATVTSPPA